MKRVRTLLARSLVLALLLLALGAGAANADPGTTPDPTAILPGDPGQWITTTLPDDPGYRIDDIVLPDDPGYPE